MFANTKKVLSFLPKAGTIPTPGPGEYNVPSDMRVAGRAASKKPPSKDGEERTSFGLEPRGFLVGTFGTKAGEDSPGPAAYSNDVTSIGHKIAKSAHLTGHADPYESDSADDDAMVPVPQSSPRAPKGHSVISSSQLVDDAKHAARSQAKSERLTWSQKPGIAQQTHKTMKAKTRRLAKVPKGVGLTMGRAARRTGGPPMDTTDYLVGPGAYNPRPELDLASAEALQQHRGAVFGDAPREGLLSGLVKSGMLSGSAGGPGPGSYSPKTGTEIGTKSNKAATRGKRDFYDPPPRRRYIPPPSPLAAADYFTPGPGKYQPRDPTLPSYAVPEPKPIAHAHTTPRHGATPRSAAAAAASSRRSSATSAASRRTSVRLMGAPDLQRRWDELRAQARAATAEAEREARRQSTKSGVSQGSVLPPPSIDTSPHRRSGTWGTTRRYNMIQYLVASGQQCNPATTPSTHSYDLSAHNDSVVIRTFNAKAGARRSSAKPKRTKPLRYSKSAGALRRRGTHSGSGNGGSLRRPSMDQQRPKSQGGSVDAFDFVFRSRPPSPFAATRTAATPPARLSRRKPPTPTPQRAPQQRQPAQLVEPSMVSSAVSGSVSSTADYTTDYTTDYTNSMYHTSVDGTSAVTASAATLSTLDTSLASEQYTSQGSSTLSET